MGDFNLKLVDYANHSPTNDFINMMFSHHLQQSVLHPTLITATASTLIDNIFINNVLGCNIQSGNILSLITDHLPQYCIISDFICDYKISSHIVYDYSHFDVNRFLFLLCRDGMAFLSNASTGIDDKFDNFLLNIHSLINKHCPQKRLNKKQLKLRSKPWINKCVFKMMKIRDRLFKQFKYTNSETDLKAFKLFRNCVVSELKESKKSYYHKCFDKNKSNMKMLGKGIKSIANLTANNLDTISHLTDNNGSEIKDPSTIANQFNHFFTNVFNDITKKIPRNPRSPLCYLTNRNKESVLVSPCSSNEVSEVIKSLKNGKSVGPNSIPIKLLKILDPYIYVNLSNLINESFETGIFQDKLKIAKVIPVFKKGLTIKTSNYRPISLLSIFRKYLKN